MGLDCSHGAFNGAYSSFQRFRKAIAEACGGSWDDEAWEWDDDLVPTEHHAGLLALMQHSDCDGELTPEECRLVSAFLRWVAPRMTSPTNGHLMRAGVTMADVAIRFADGCDLAAQSEEPLIFA